MNSKRSINLFIKPDLLFNINHLCHNRNTPNSPDETNIKQKMLDQKFIDRIFGSMKRKKSLVLANNQNHLKSSSRFSARNHQSKSPGLNRAPANIETVLSVLQRNEQTKDMLDNKISLKELIHLLIESIDASTLIQNAERYFSFN